MTKWKIVRNLYPEAAPVGDVPCSPVEMIKNYSNECIREHIGPNVRGNAIRIHNMVSIAGKTPAELGMAVPRSTAKRFETVLTKIGEYNGSGHHFIRLRPGITLEDFEIVTLK